MNQKVWLGMVLFNIGGYKLDGEVTLEVNR